MTKTGMTLCYHWKAVLGWGILLLAFAMSGCLANPAISDIRSDVVKVQIASDVINYRNPGAVEREAQRGCAEYGNVISHALSERCVRPGAFGICLVKEYLFACKKVN